ncbi:HYOU1 family protein [Megaselia abdita]
MRLFFVISTLFLVFNVNQVENAAFSVDLGSEWMKVGVVSPGVPMEIALNKESKRKSPSVLAFRDGFRTFGEDAQQVGIRFPPNSHAYLMDLLGKTVDNPIVDLYRKRFPQYEIIPDEERNTVVFKGEDEQFSVEELIAQMLLKAKEFAENFSNLPMSDVVLVVPGYFGQAERQALLTAGKIAKLKVLSLINDYTAVALNYGVFNQANINETAQYFIFYDMGAQKTSAALVSYQLVKDKQTKETSPVVQVLGVGYDRNLGGLEIQLRLRDYLAKEFNAMKKTKTDVFTNSKSMAKLFKEAGRVKNVLSANSDHFAQIENLLDEQDFKLKVTRETLESLCEDIWPRVVKPLQNAVKAAGLSLDTVKQVILFGGGTRVPKVQEILKEEIKSELGKNLNADEAAAMGAVYKAAELTHGFKVKKFIVKDAVLFPIQVTFERESNDGGAAKTVKRVLFGQMNSYPQKKVITFNKHTSDFDFFIHYGDLNHLPEGEISNLGTLNFSQVSLKGVSDVLDSFKKNEGVDSKGIKAYFVLDESGILTSPGVEYVYDKPKVEDDIESTLSKLGSTITNLFGGKKDEKPEEVEKKEGEENNGEEVNKEEKPDEKETEKPVEEKPEEKKDEKVPEDNAAAKNETVKLVVVKEPVEFVVSYKYTQSLAGSSLDASIQKLDKLNKAEADRAARESIFNALESHAIETQEKLSHDEYASCATETEIEKIVKECNDVSDWLYEDGSDADIKEYEKRLRALEKLTNVVFARHWEHEERPEAVKAMKNLVDASKKFHISAQNMTKETNPDKDIFTTGEVVALEKALNETIKWFDTQTEEQKKLPKNQDVIVTVKDITDKMALLEREVNYLVSKMKYWRPKKPKVVEEKKNKTEEATPEDKPSNDTTEVPTDTDDNDAKEEKPNASGSEQPVDDHSEL